MLSNFFFSGLWFCFHSGIFLQVCGHSHLKKRLWKVDGRVSGLVGFPVAQQEAPASQLCQFLQQFSVLFIPG